MVGWCWVGGRLKGGGGRWNRSYNAVIDYYDEISNDYDILLVWIATLRWDERRAMAARVVIVIRHLSWVVIAVPSNVSTRHTLRGCSRCLDSARKGERTLLI